MVSESTPEWMQSGGGWPAEYLATRELLEAIRRVDPLQGPFLERSLASLQPADFRMLERYIELCARRGCDPNDLAEAYRTICVDMRKEQLYFARHGAYRHSRYQDVADAVYRDEDYMPRYMHGLALTTFLWPNHLRLKEFFLKKLPCDRAGRYLEIGPGHGLFFLNAVQQSRYDHFEGIDISQSSVDLTSSILVAAEVDSSRYRIRCGDFLSRDFSDGSGEQPGAFDAIVMGEVLEHVERPGDFLQRIHQLSAPESFVYVTTCVNAPAVDHIYLFRDPAEVAALACQSGFAVVDELLVPHAELDLEETQRRKLPINVALVLAKR
jgi:2-polyprenyl-3-methyl-5-hydroxy-6-metoxy-1,4-benzoquinol methylase